jgi:hypothetical protein
MSTLKPRPFLTSTSKPPRTSRTTIAKTSKPTTTTITTTTAISRTTTCHRKIRPAQTKMWNQ